MKKENIKIHLYLKVIVKIAIKNLYIRGIPLPENIAAINAKESLNLLMKLFQRLNRD
jgi:hypothetical protein